jgi:hypothetical protein
MGSIWGYHEGFSELPSKWIQMQARMQSEHRNVKTESLGIVVCLSQGKAKLFSKMPTIIYTSNSNV